MCGICMLPTTHANTFTTISTVSLFLMVFWTFLWAWWIVTKIRVENYFVDTFHSILAARQDGYGHTLRRLLRTNKKWQIGLFLLLVSGGLLVWAGLSDRERFIPVELIDTESYLEVPVVEPVGSDLLQVSTPDQLRTNSGPTPDAQLRTPGFRELAPQLRTPNSGHRASGSYSLFHVRGVKMVPLGW